MASPNWHWKSKLVTPWAKSWFQQELKITVKGDDNQEVTITDIDFVDGDVELGQRKSKLIAIYDVHLKLTWSGKATDGSDVNGTLVRDADIPEVSHEITLDQLHDYVYNWELTTPATDAVLALYELARARLTTALEAKFAEFPSLLMATHGKDITVSTPTSQDPSRAATPVAPTAANVNPATSANQTTSTKKNGQAINTTSITIDASFMASADDLFSILTDEKRIPHWSRNSAVSNPTAGSAYSLFGGGVKGTYTSVSPTKFIQTWALQNPSWPADHFATLTTAFDQSTDSTKVTWTMTGVPVGLEDEIRRNLQGYYVGGLKSIGCVQIPPLTQARHNSVSSQTSYSLHNTHRPYVAILIGLLILIAAFTIPSFLH